MSTTSDPVPVTFGPYNVPAAQQVSALSVVNNNPSAAAGARTQYVVGFHVSSTGGMSRAANSEITVSFPSGTGFTGYTGGAVVDTTSSPTTTIGSCGSPSGTVIKCGLFGGEAIPASHNVSITFSGITNPAAGTPTLSVSTTSDPAAVTSPAFSVVAANQVSALSVALSNPSAAAGARTQYVVGFHVSSTGGMSRAANSEITVSFPSGTGFTGYTGGAVVDTTSSPTTTIGSCGSPSGTVIKCGLFGGEAIPASHNVSITFSGITNPAAGTPTLSVSTTSDPAAVTSPAFSVVAANQVSALSVALSNPSAAAGARTQYVVGFHVSSTGGMSRAANSEITVSFPSGTGFTGYTGGAVVDTTSSPTTTIGSCGSPSGTVIKCGLFGGEAIPASHNVSITFSGITNPAAGTPTLSVSTTSDPAAVTSGQYTVVGANQLSGVTLALDSSTPSATTRWVTNFQLSGTGGISRAANSEIPVSFPSGTTFTNYTGGAVVDVTSGTTVGSCGSPSGLVIKCALFGGQAIAANRNVRITFNNITNPSSSGPWTINVSTTSDPAPVTSEQATAPPPDTTPPDTTIVAGPSGSTDDDTPTFEFGANEAGSTLECSIDGAPFAPCSSPFTTPPLPAGPHTFSVRARDAAGNVGAAQTSSFTVAPKKIEDLPPPTVGEEVNIGPVPGSGPVLIAVPAGTAAARAGASQKGLTFVPLTEARQIPTGSFLDTTRGTVQMVTATGQGQKTQSGKFSSGLFQVRQSRARRDRGLTDLRLQGGNFKRCGKKGGRSASAALSRRRLRRLRSSVSGRFRTTGRNSSATVRGTVWTVTDRCDGTLTQVKRGTVVVRDFHRKRNVVLHAGKSYLARAPR